MRAQTRALAQHATPVAASLRAAIPAPATPHGRSAVVMLMGFPGSGKSHVARLLAVRIRAAHVASDHIRSQLFVAASYTVGENAAVFRAIDELVGSLLDEGHRVIVDATHLRHAQREGIESVARGRGAPLAHVLVTADDDEIRRRLAGRRRERAAGDMSDADERVYAAMRARGFEPPAGGHYVVRSGGAIEDEVERLARELESRPIVIGQEDW